LKITAMSMTPLQQRTLDRQVSDPRPKVFDKSARFDDGRMLDPRGDNVIAFAVHREVRP
jgi:hypothetical protein